MQVCALVRSAVVLFALTASLPARAAIVYVNRNAPGAVHDGSSWSTAFTTVQAGVNAAAAGDEVWVAAGAYVENVTISNGIGLYGGFTGDEAQLTQRDWRANATMLDGNGAGPAVTAHAALDQRVALDGFTLRNGSNSTSGATVYVNGGTAALANNTVVGGQSAAVLLNASTSTLTSNTITCDGHFATGVDIEGGSATLASNAISRCGYLGVRVDRNATATLLGNSLSSNGTGAFVYRGAATITGNVVCGNGPGIQITVGSAVLEGNLLYGNGMYGVQAAGSSVVMTNNTVAYTEGEGIWVEGQTAMTNNVVAFSGQYGIFLPNAYGSVVTAFSHNDVYGSGWADYFRFVPPSGRGNLSVDPRFVRSASGGYMLGSGSPCVDAGDDSVVTSGATDFAGNSRIAGTHVDIGAYELVPTAALALGATVSAAPAASEGAVYVGGENGRLYALTSPSLAPLPGFPVDIGAAANTTVKLNSRPAVYYGKTGKAIYLTTHMGHVVKVMPDGKIAWIQQPLGGPSTSTPAVTPDGNVYVDLGLGSASVLNFAFKLDETSGQPKYISPYLGSSSANSLLDRSPAIDSRYCYLNASTSNLGSLAVLNQDNLTVRASFAPGEEALPPFLSGGSIFVATKAGSLYKVNGITMSPDLTFGSLGTVKLGEAITAGPFLYQGKVYVGTESGKVYRVDAGSGAKSLFIDSGANSAITGLLITSSGTLAFTTATGTFQQMPIGNAVGRQITGLGGEPAGGPVYDPTQARFFAVATAGQLYSIPAM